MYAGWLIYKEIIDKDTGEITVLVVITQIILEYRRQHFVRETYLSNRKSQVA